MGTTRPLKLHRGTVTRARCCWLDTTAYILLVVALCTNDDDPASICKDKIRVLSKLDMGKLIILSFKNYGRNNRSQGIKNLYDITIDDLRSTFHKYMLVPPRGATGEHVQATRHRYGHPYRQLYPGLGASV